MMRLAAAVLIAVCVLLTAGQSAAVGPDDGIWLVLQSNPTHGAFQYYTSVHQNGATVVLMSAYGNGTWDFGIGTRSGNTVQGVAYDAVTGVAYGTVSVTLTSSTTFSGQANIGGVVWSLSGVKLF
jgi:hypothetical protein